MLLKYLLAAVRGKDNTVSIFLFVLFFFFLLASLCLVSVVEQTV